MSNSPNLRFLFLSAAASLALAGLSSGGVFVRETLADVVNQVRSSHGNTSAFLGNVVSRKSIPNSDPAMADTFVTVVEIQGENLVTGEAGNFRFHYLGALGNFYRTTAQPEDSLVEPGKAILLVLEKTKLNTGLVLHGLNRLAPVIRNQSGQDVTVSQGAGFFINANTLVSDVRNEFRKAAK